MKILINDLLKLIEVAKILALKENDLRNAKDYLLHNEFGLCFETIITQMYEDDIKIDNEIYKSISKIGESINLVQDSYCFMKELIRENIPKSV